MGHDGSVRRDLLRLDRSRVDARRIRLGDGVAEDSFEEGVFHLGDVGAQFGCDLDLAVGRFAVGQGERVVVLLGSRQHQTLHAAGVADIPAVVAEHQQYAFGRECDDSVHVGAVPAAVESVFRHLRGKADDTVAAVEEHARRLFGQPDLIRIRRVDIGNDVRTVARHLGRRHVQQRSQILRRVDVADAVVAGVVVAFVDLHLAFAVTVGNSVGGTENVVAPFALGLAFRTGHEVPFHAGDGEAYARSLFTVDEGVFLVFDLDVAGIGRTDFGVGKRDLKGRFRRPVVERDFRSGEDRVLAARNGHGNRDGVGVVGTHGREGQYRRIGRIEFEVRGVVLRGEVNPVAAVGLGFAAGVGRIVGTPCEHESRNKRV